MFSHKPYDKGSGKAVHLSILAAERIEIYPFKTVEVIFQLQVVN